MKDHEAVIGLFLMEKLLYRLPWWNGFQVKSDQLMLFQDFMVMIA
jgi:hypothetical protein